MNGTINKRLINNKYYYYYQYLNNGKQVSKLIGEEEAYDLALQLYSSSDEELFSHQFNLDVNYGKNLYMIARDYRIFKKRFCYQSIDDFLHQEKYINRLFILYGLRRTGKTTLMFQTINSLSLKDFAKAVYLKCNINNTFTQLIDDIKYLISKGFKYIYIDEVTLLYNFMEMSSVLSDIYGLMAKIILSGTDSLGFLISTRNELYDRAILLHTTYILYKEFKDVLGINSIDKYIEYGGTMSPEGVDYNKVININSNARNEYVDSAISHNIIHSLKLYKDGIYFSSLHELYERGELENVINRVVEDANHRFLISVIEKEFKSHDYGSLKQLVELPNNAKLLSGTLRNVDEEKLINDLMNSLSIINKEQQTYKIDEDVLKEIEEYLSLLDVYSKIDEVIYPTFKNVKRNVITQPGLRYAQAKILLNILLEDESILKYNQIIIDALKEKLLSDVKGRMIEDIILLETSLIDKNAFKFTYGPFGEYDMVRLDKSNQFVDLYEIKYSSIIEKRQTKYLHDQTLNDIIVEKYYPIRNRIVIYQGESKVVEDIKYININEYIDSLY